MRKTHLIVLQIGIASFSGEGQLEWDLNDPQTANNNIIESSILSIVHLASFTNTPDGLMVARQQIFNTAGDRYSDPEHRDPEHSDPEHRHPNAIAC